MKKKRTASTLDENPVLRLLLHRAFSLLQTNAYFERYYQILADLGHGNAKKAWEAVEEELYDLTELNRYSTYESFRLGRYKYIRGLRNCYRG